MKKTNIFSSLDVFAPPKHHTYPLNRVVSYQQALDQLTGQAPVPNGSAAQDSLGQVALNLMVNWPKRCAPREDILESMQLEEKNRLFKWALDEGVFVERKTSCYGFCTDQLRDFLAARHLARSAGTKWDSYRSFWYQDGWEGVLPLWAAYLGNVMDNARQCNDLVESVRQEGDPGKQKLHLPLLMAGLCLAEGVPVEPEVKNSVLEELYALWTPHGSDPAPTHTRSPIPQLLNRWLTVIFSGIVNLPVEQSQEPADKLLSLLEATCKEAISLENLCRKEALAEDVPEEVFGGWLHHLYSDGDRLAFLTPWTEQPVEVVEVTAPNLKLKCLRDQMEGMAVALAHCVGQCSGVWDRLHGLLTNRSGFERVLVNGLGEAGQGDGPVTDYLLQMAGSQTEDELRVAALESMGAAGVSDSRFASLVRETIVDSKASIDVGTSAASVGAWAHLDTTEMISALGKAIVEHDLGLREAAAGSLKALVDNPSIPSRLSNELGSDDMVTRSGAALVAAALGSNDDRIPRILFSTVATLLGEEARIGALGEEDGEPFAEGDDGEMMDDKMAEAAGTFAQVLADSIFDRADTRDVLLAAVSRKRRPELDAACLTLALFCFRLIEDWEESPVQHVVRDGTWANSVLEEVLGLVDDSEDPVWAEQAWVAAVLGQGNPRALQVLQRQLGRDLDTEEMAELAGILAATHTPKEWMFEYFENCLKSSSPEVVLAGIEAVGELPLDSSFMKEAPQLVEKIKAHLEDSRYPMASAAYTSAFNLQRLPAPATV